MSRIRHNFPRESCRAYGEVMKTISSLLGFSESDIAQLRLRCVSLLERHGYQAVHVAYPSVSRASVYRWKHALKDSGGKLSSLLPHSTRPHRVRQMHVPPNVLSFLRATREQYPKLSKKPPDWW